MKKRANTYASVWDALADTPAQAANLQARADLLRGRVSRFSLDALVNIATPRWGSACTWGSKLPDTQPGNLGGLVLAGSVSGQ